MEMLPRCHTLVSIPGFVRSCVLITVLWKNVKLVVVKWGQQCETLWNALLNSLCILNPHNDLIVSWYVVCLLIN